MGLYEDKRAWYLQQLAAGDIDSSTSLLTLKKLYLAKTLGDGVIPVWEGDSIQSAVDAAAALLGYARGKHLTKVEVTFPDNMPITDTITLTVRGIGYYNSETLTLAEIGLAEAGTGAEVAAAVELGTYEDAAYLTLSAADAVVTITPSTTCPQPFTLEVTSSNSGVVAEVTDSTAEHYLRTEAIVAADMVEWTIACAAGVDTTHLSCPGVTVTSMQDRQSHASTVQRVSSLREREPELFAIPLPLPQVALRIDDAAANIRKTDWEGDMFGAGVSFAQYCANNGVPVGHAVVASKPQANDAAYLTVAQLRTLHDAMGCELLCHTYTHPVGDAVPDDDDADGWWRELIYSRQVIESLATPTRDTVGPYDGSFPLPNNAEANELGLNVRGLILSGDIGGDTGTLTEMGTLAAWNDLRGQMIREHYEHSTGSLFGMYHAGMGLNPSRYGWDKALYLYNAWTQEDVDCITSTPNARVIAMCDCSHLDNATYRARIKANIDLLVTARNAGKLLLVNPSAIFNSVTPAAVTGAAYEWGGLVNGNCNGFANETALGDSALKGNWMRHGGAAVASVRGEGDMQLDLAAGTMASVGACLKGGHEYCARIDAKGAEAGATLEFRVAHSGPAGATSNMIRLKHPSVPALTTDFATYYFTFGLPRWAAPAQLLTFRIVGQAGSIDNAALVQIG